MPLSKLSTVEPLKPSNVKNRLGKRINMSFLYFRSEPNPELEPLSSQAAPHQNPTAPQRWHRSNESGERLISCPFPVKLEYSDLHTDY